MEILMLVGMFWLGVYSGRDSSQQTIDRFKSVNVCVENKVGADLIKKCYRLEEIK